jgi:hypothetical protein
VKRPIAVLLLVGLLYISGQGPTPAAWETTGGVGVINVLLSVLAAAILVSTKPWYVLRYGCTLAHEMAHTCTAALLGAAVHHTKISLDSSGLATYAVDEDFGRGRILLVTLAGYAGPGVVGLSAVWCVKNDLAFAWVVWACIASLVTGVVFMRNLWGLFSALAASLVCWVLFRYTSGMYLTTVVLVIGYVLMFGGVIAAREQLRAPDDAATDARQVADIIHASARGVGNAQLLVAVALIVVSISALVL